MLCSKRTPFVLIYNLNHFTLLYALCLLQSKRQIHQRHWFIICNRISYFPEAEALHGGPHTTLCRQNWPTSSQSTLHLHLCNPRWCWCLQVVEDGYEFFAKRQLVTLFSAPNYCGEFDNAGGMMSVDETLMCSFQVSSTLSLCLPRSPSNIILYQYQ